MKIIDRREEWRAKDGPELWWKWQEYKPFLKRRFKTNAEKQQAVYNNMLINASAQNLARQQAAAYQNLQQLGRGLL